MKSFNLGKQCIVIGIDKERLATISRSLYFSVTRHSFVKNGAIIIELQNCFVSTIDIRTQTNDMPLNNDFVNVVSNIEPSEGPFKCAYLSVRTVPCEILKSNSGDTF